MPVIKEKHIARVTNNLDEQKRGRVRVTCPGLMGDDETVLPDWIEPAFDWGMFTVPDIGELIEIECIAQNDQEEDVPYQAFLENPDLKWTGARFDSLEAGTPRPTDTLYTSKNYGKRRGFATPAGHVLMFDDTDGDQSVVLTWRRGAEFSQLTMDKDGSILLLDRKSNMIHINAEDGKEGITILDKTGNMVALRESGTIINDSFSNFIELKDGVVAVSAAGDAQIQAGLNINLQAGAGAAVINLGTSGDVDITCANAKIDADTYALGKGADSPPMRHTEWEAWALAHTHPFVGTAPGVSGVTLTPVPPPPANIASSVGTLKCSIWSVLFTLTMFFWFLR